MTGRSSRANLIYSVVTRLSPLRQKTRGQAGLRWKLSRQGWLSEQLRTRPRRKGGFNNSADRRAGPVELRLSAHACPRCGSMVALDFVQRHWAWHDLVEPVDTDPAPDVAQADPGPANSTPWEAK